MQDPGIGQRGDRAAWLSLATIGRRRANGGASNAPQASERRSRAARIPQSPEYPARSAERLRSAVREHVQLVVGHEWQRRRQGGEHDGDMAGDDLVQALAWRHGTARAPA